MSSVAILIALFTAAQNPTTKNCGNLVNALVRQATRDVFIPGEKTHFDEDLDLIKTFVTKQCKDGIKR